jgi:hypothetical protein
VTVHDAVDRDLRLKILFRATGKCEICGWRPAEEEGLCVGHLLSVKVGFQAGLPDDLLNSEENLAAMCYACNAAIGDGVLPLRLAIAILQHRREEST